MIWAIAILVLLILITYLIYPVIVILLSDLKSNALSDVVVDHSNQPKIFILLSAHNEESVIREKMESILRSNINHDKLYCYVGTDNCSDNTVEILQSFQGQLNLNLTIFNERKGKPAIINYLVKKIEDDMAITTKDLFLLTDANVLFHEDFIAKMSSSFSDPKVGLVDGKVINPSKSVSNSESESVYLALETKIKRAEGHLWNCSMGPFGGAYMIRAKLYEEVPNTFLVDDFFVFFKILQRDYHVIVNDQAICYESVSGSFKEEFRRKMRISAGNFQNSIHFLRDYLKIWKLRNIVFICHKLLRWLTPLFGVAVIALLTILSFSLLWPAKVLLIMISLLVGIPLVNYLLNQLNLNLKPLKGVTYLIMMNIALLLGFFKYLKGINTNVWEPTKRNTSTEHH